MYDERKSNWANRCVLQKKRGAEILTILSAFVLFGLVFSSCKNCDKDDTSHPKSAPIPTDKDKPQGTIKPYRESEIAPTPTDKDKPQNTPLPVPAPTPTDDKDNHPATAPTLTTEQVKLVKTVRDEIEVLDNKIKTLTPDLIGTIDNEKPRNQVKISMENAEKIRGIAEHYAIISDKAVGTWKFEDAVAVQRAKAEEDVKFLENVVRDDLAAANDVNTHLFKPGKEIMDEDNALKAWLELLNANVDLCNAAIGLITSRLK
jgi:hypothetical protein